MWYDKVSVNVVVVGTYHHSVLGAVLMVAVTQTTGNVWSISLNGDELELVQALSGLQKMSLREIVVQTMALGLLAYANIAMDEMEENLYGEGV